MAWASRSPPSSTGWPSIRRDHRLHGRKALGLQVASRFAQPPLARLVYDAPARLVYDALQQVGAPQWDDAARDLARQVQAACGATPDGDPLLPECTRLIDPMVRTAGRTLARTALRLLQDPDARDAAWAEFETRRDANPVPPLADYPAPVDLPWPEYVETPRGRHWHIPG